MHTAGIIYSPVMCGKYPWTLWLRLVMIQRFIYICRLLPSKMTADGGRADGFHRWHKRNVGVHFKVTQIISPSLRMSTVNCVHSQRGDEKQKYMGTGCIILIASSISDVPEGRQYIIILMNINYTK